MSALQPGDEVFIKASTAGNPLIKEDCEGNIETISFDEDETSAEVYIDGNYYYVNISCLSKKVS